MTNLEDASPGSLEFEAREGRPNSDYTARAIGRLISGLGHGKLRIVLPFGAPIVLAGAEPEPEATITLNRWRALRRVLGGGDIGFGEGYVAGDWTTPDLVAVIRLANRNIHAMEQAMRGGALFRWANRLRHLLRGNSRRGSRRNIVAHYDLGNDFYRLWLDAAMQYSSAVWDESAPDLEAAQARKLDLIGERLGLKGGESVLEIGCGWGALAARLAEESQARVTAITLSPSQLALARERAAARGLAGRIDFRLQDYRDVSGRFDRIVSIEMLEAVGEAWLPAYFRTLARCLAPGGRAVLQAITIAEDRYEAYRRDPDFLQKHIFPGGFLPSKKVLAEQIELAGLRLTHCEGFGQSYAKTLAEWRRRFHARWPEIAAQGFDERFRRLWDYYLSYCEAGFAERMVDVGHYTVELAAVPLGR